ncbi:MAG: hypothetical protein K0Q43_220 [Ramlibacter sp.]|jgi:hypothetical protein|nr:hypothetical protein [Ramlibacter sp.]
MRGASAIRAILLFIGYLAMGTLATLRQSARVMVLRPEWTRIADSAPSFFWFAGVALAAAQLRWSLLGGLPFWFVVQATGIHMVLVIIVFERAERSSALVFLCWAASTGIDLLASAMMLLDLPSNQGDLRLGVLALELSLYLLLYRDFKRQPAAIRRRGYLRGKAAGGPVEDVEDHSEETKK